MITKSSQPKTLPCGRPAPQPEAQSENSAALYKKLVVQLSSYCLEKKLNRSDTRNNILEVIVSGSRHFTALELLERLEKRFPDIGKATLYRNLKVFVESGILQEGPHDPAGQLTFEIGERDHHDHIVCKDCKRIFEFHDYEIEKRQNKVTTQLDFTPGEHHHVIYASCNYYQKKLSRAPSSRGELV